MNSTPGSIQELHLPIEAVEGGEAGVVVVRGHGAELLYRAIMEVSGIPLADLPGGDQEAALSGYAAFLNGLTHPVQLLVRSQPIDLEGHVAEILARAEAPDTPRELAELAQDYAAYVQGLGAQRTLLARRFFLVVPATLAAPPRRLSLAGAAQVAVAMARRRGQPTPQVVRIEALAQLGYRCDEIRRQLLRCGMVARRLTEHEVVQLCRQCWSPERARLFPLSPERLRDYSGATSVELISSSSGRTTDGAQRSRQSKETYV